MGAAINDLMVDSGPSIYYSDKYRGMIEDHLLYIRGHETTDVVEVSPGDAYAFEGDLFGLLRSYGSPQELHWIIMRLNGYTSPMEYEHQHSILLIPSKTVIDDLTRTFRVNHRIK